MSSTISATRTTLSRGKWGAQSSSDFTAAAAAVRRYPVTQVESSKNYLGDDALFGRSKAELTAAKALVELSKVARAFK